MCVLEFNIPSSHHHFHNGQIFEKQPIFSKKYHFMDSYLRGMLLGQSQECIHFFVWNNNRQILCKSNDNCTKITKHL